MMGRFLLPFYLFVIFIRMIDVGSEYLFKVF